MRKQRPRCSISPRKSPLTIDRRKFSKWESGQTVESQNGNTSFTLPLIGPQELTPPPRPLLGPSFPRNHRAVGPPLPEASHPAIGLPRPLPSRFCPVPASRPAHARHSMPRYFPLPHRSRIPHRHMTGARSLGFHPIPLPRPTCPRAPKTRGEGGGALVETCRAPCQMHPISEAGGALHLPQHMADHSLCRCEKCVTSPLCHPRIVDVKMSKN